MVIDTIGKSDAKVLIDENEVLKIETTSLISNNEYHMLKLLNCKLPVPKVMDFYQKNGENYLRMSKIKGKMLCDKEIIEEPYKVVKLAASSLKKLWEINIDDCKEKFIINLDKKLEIARFRVENGLVDTSMCEEETFNGKEFSNPLELLVWLENNKPKCDKLVLSHGDFCLPNIFVDGENISGYIDLGLCGLDDIYQDIAICYRSLRDNIIGRYSNGKNQKFDIELIFSELGIVPDYNKIRYYLLLDELF